MACGMCVWLCLVACGIIATAAYVNVKRSLAGEVPLPFYVLYGYGFGCNIVSWLMGFFTVRETHILAEITRAWEWFVTGCWLIVVSLLCDRCSFCASPWCTSTNTACPRWCP